MLFLASSQLVMGGESLGLGHGRGFEGFKFPASGTCHDLAGYRWGSKVLVIEVIVHLAVVMILVLLYFLVSPRCNASDAPLARSNEMSLSPST
jgi:hypothetical protein